MYECSLPAQAHPHPPSLPIQLIRHTEEYQQKVNVWDQLYGMVLDDETEVTSILPFAEGHKSTREELEGMERHNDELLSSFNLDKEKIGMYNICYTRNF